MSEERIVKVEADEEDHNDSIVVQEESAVTRRDFIQKTLAAASALALTRMLPNFSTEAGAAEVQAASCQTPGQPLNGILEFKSSKSTKTLRAVLKILNENKSYLAAPAAGGTKPVCQSGQMRFFSGYDLNNPGPVWPGVSGVPTPGPTFRARVGDTVQITLLNQVDVSAFGNTIDVAETGQTCDTSKSVDQTGVAINTYPGNPSFENPPDCFHGSSSANLHFHGTHVSPRSISDNVLVNVRPSPIVAGKPVVDEKFVKADFDEIFAACSKGHAPEKWSDLPPTWQQTQQKLLQDYDKTAPWQGGRGLPVDQQLWMQDQMEIDSGQWPQYYIGAYPNCLQIPIWNGQANSMGQAPGTHWYHGHKHGSTALNLANGMAGALIIEGPYDDTLNPFYTKQLVLVAQQFGAQVNLLKSGNPNSNQQVNADLAFVNGQFTPVIKMNPNEMQFWRIINACHQKALPLNPPVPVAPTTASLKWVQTAQDGVQLDPSNYNPAVTNATFPVPALAPNPPTLPSSSGSLAPANRIDLLVQAPSTPGNYQVTFGGKNVVLFTVEVKQDPNVKAIPSPMPFPTAAQFPKMPGFLTDIDPGKVTVRRELHFASVADPSSPKPAANRGTKPPFAAPKHTINGKQFDSHIDQAMLLGATEEWTMYNDSQGAAHPFHIHINPFQVTEILNPAVSKNPVKLAGPWIWWDNFAIPPAAIPPDGDGKTVVSGYFKMLSRFVDYTGMYVLHCHILGHEDRGMMQLVEVVTNTTTMQHK